MKKLLIFSLLVACVLIGLNVQAQDEDPVKNSYNTEVCIVDVDQEFEVMPGGGANILNSKKAYQLLSCTALRAKIPYKNCYRRARDRCSLRPKLLRVCKFYRIGLG